MSTIVDFNHRNLNARMNARIDIALQKIRAKQEARDYLGGSRLGVACARALQFEFFHTPPDPGREFSGRLLRVFDAGHVFEDLAIGWIRAAGFELRTRARDGGQFEFSTLNGLIKGHLDGVLVDGPEIIKYPALWECKSMKDKKWKECVKNGVAKAQPVYAGQIAVYQGYMGLAENPAIFTAVNKDTEEIWFEAVPYDATLAQRLSDRGLLIIQACQAGEILPRIASTPDHFECKFCSWQDRCWRLPY